MFHTLIIDSSNLGTGEFKKSRSVNSIPAISSVFLYLGLIFFCMSLLPTYRVDMRSFSPSPISLTYNANTGLGLRDKAVFTVQRPRQHETSLFLEKQIPECTGGRWPSIKGTQRRTRAIAEERNSLESSRRAIIFWLPNLTLGTSDVLLFLILIYIFILEFPFPHTQMLCLGFSIVSSLVFPKFMFKEEELLWLTLSNQTPALPVSPHPTPYISLSIFRSCVSTSLPIPLPPYLASLLMSSFTHN